MTVNQSMLLDSKAAAKMLSISTRTLWTLQASKQIPHVKLGSRIVRFDPADLTAYIDQQKTK